MLAHQNSHRRLNQACELLVMEGRRGEHRLVDATQDSEMNSNEKNRNAQQVGILILYIPWTKSMLGDENSQFCPNGACQILFMAG